MVCFQQFLHSSVSARTSIDVRLCVIILGLHGGFASPRHGKFACGNAKAKAMAKSKAKAKAKATAKAKGILSVLQCFCAC